MPPKKPKAKSDAAAAAAANPTPPADRSNAPDSSDQTEEEPEEEEESRTGQKQLREGADVSRVTDFVEQKELDSAKASRALASLTADDNVDREQEREREKELAAVKIDQVDVDLIMREMELGKEAAERKLREHKGDVVQTLNALVSA